MCVCVCVYVCIKLSFEDLNFGLVSLHLTNMCQ